MSRSEMKRIDSVIERNKNRLADMNDLIMTGQASDAVRTGFVTEAAKLIKELNKLGVQVETPTAFLTLAASKAGIPVAAPAGTTGVAVEQAAPVAADFGATTKAVDFGGDAPAFVTKGSPSKS